MGLISRVSSRTYRYPPEIFYIIKMALSKEEIAKKLAGKAGMRSKAAGQTRKKKVTQTSSSVSDDKRIQQTLKKFACSSLPGIDEVNMFKEDGTVIHFKNQKVPPHQHPTPSLYPARTKSKRSPKSPASSASSASKVSKASRPGPKPRASTPSQPSTPTLTLRRTDSTPSRKVATLTRLKRTSSSNAITTA